MSQLTLAEEVDMSQRWVSDLERGVIKVPRPEVMWRLAEALNLPLGELYAAAYQGATSRDAQLMASLAEEAATSRGDNGDAAQSELLKAWGELSPAGQESLMSFANYLLKQESDQRRRAKRAEQEPA